MKKVLLFIMTVMMCMSLVACGGDDSSTTDQEASKAIATDTTLVSKEAHYTTILVPSDFSDFVDNEGLAIAQSSGASIGITQTVETDVSIEDMTEEYLLGLMSATYSDVEVVSFENPVTMGGVDAVSIVFTGTGATTGRKHTVQHITLFFTLEDINCEQQLLFTYDTEAKTSLEAHIEEILESISLEF